MKRTETVNHSNYRKKNPLFMLTPIALIVGGAAIFMSMNSGKEESVNAAVYLDAQECITANPSLQDECNNAFSTAMVDAEKTAPKYDSLASCEAEFGAENCAPTSTVMQPSENAGAATQQAQAQASSPSWMPLMAGFMMGRMMSGGYAQSPMFTSTAKNSAMNGKFYDATGKNFGSMANRSVKTTPAAFAPKPATSQTITRGGFGQSVAKHNQTMSKQSSSANNRATSNRSTTTRAPSRSFGG